MKTLNSKLQTPKSKAYRQLAADLAGYTLEPYRWVLYAGPWSEEQLTEFNGQDKWQCEQLEAICAKLRIGDGRKRPRPVFGARHEQCSGGNPMRQS